MKILLYEHVTGGGMGREDLPAGLAREADLMIRSLVADLLAVPGVALLTSRDARLQPIDGVELVQREPDEPPLAFFARAVAGCDAAWPTAPETGGILEELARTTLAAGRALLGSRPGAIRVAASKYATSRVLRTAGLAAVETFQRGEVLSRHDGFWAIKPDDGAGCEGVRRLPDRSAAEAALMEGPSRLVAQPWLEGDPGSLCLLCDAGQARVLSVNRQRIGFTDDEPVLEGLTVNASAVAPEHRALADGVARALPGLWGCAGVDFVATTDGLVVLEVNPRLTTSFAVLRRATRLNAPALTLGLLSRPLDLARPVGPGTVVEMSLGGVRVP